MKATLSLDLPCSMVIYGGNRLQHDKAATRHKGHVDSTFGERVGNNASFFFSKSCIIRVSGSNGEACVAFIVK